MPPIDLQNATTATPPDIGVQTQPDRVNVATAEAVVPKVVQGITISPMLPVTYAGLQLAKIVLSILGISLAALVLYLWTSEWRYSSNQANIYEKILSQTTSVADSSPVLAETYAKTFRNIAPDSAFAAEEQAAAQRFFANLKRAGSISDQQLASLNGCMNLSASDGRAAALVTCAGILEEVSKKILATSPALEHIRLLTDFSKQVNEHRQNFHTAWFQEAQLILLNLLLPLLTGLFGYIFGTQQAPSARRDAG